MPRSTEKTRRPPARALSPIPFRVTEDERKRIAEAAARVGLTTSAYIRSRVLDEAPAMRATRKPSVEAEKLAQLLGHTGKIVGNIQRLAGKIGPDAKPKIDIAAVITEVRDTAAAIMESLGRKPHDH